MRTGSVCVKLRPGHKRAPAGSDLQRHPATVTPYAVIVSAPGAVADVKECCATKPI